LASPLLFLPHDVAIDIRIDDTFTRRFIGSVPDVQVILPAPDPTSGIGLKTGKSTDYPSP
jgi:hypothetical protein